MDAFPPLLCPQADFEKSSERAVRHAKCRGGGGGTGYPAPKKPFRCGDLNDSCNPSNFFQTFGRIRVDLLSYNSKSTDILVRRQHNWIVEKIGRDAAMLAAFLHPAS